MGILFALALFALLPLPPGYVREDALPCRFVAPERNAGIAQELAPVCRDQVPRIYRQLGLVRKAAQMPHVEVRVVADPIDMHAVGPRGALPPGWSGAVAYPDLDLVILSLHHGSGAPTSDLPATLLHEVSHVALRKALKGADVPRWLTEGVAIAQSEPLSVRRYWLLTLASHGDALLPLSRMDRRYPTNETQVELAYAEAADFTAFLLGRGGWPRIRALAGKVAAGRPFGDAVHDLYGRDVKELERDWRRALAERVGLVPLLTGTGMIWGLMVVLFVAAYVAVQHRRKRRLREMEQEESAVLAIVTPRPVPKRPVPMPPMLRGPVRTKILVDGKYHTLH
ncbi:MAG: peptidase MA family metallohydrolase [Deltaproteobacteria bacterium]|nr:peptidase MA family metallohydrolase [Deltaproteobacteria bacterium]